MTNATFTLTYTYTYKVAWWLKYYKFLFKITFRLMKYMGMNPQINEEKLQYWIGKAITMKITYKAKPTRTIKGH